ncbi:alpha/beta hydrolase [Xylariaceae sp. FL0804]|nr:alpha/beta hydrolase [Xylariaceae sp. FL0804]
MVQVTEGTFEVDGVSLFTKTWLPDGPPRARLVMFHGFSDHVDRYYGFFPALAARGVAVHGVDQRGWGRSAPRHADKGRTGPTPRVLADMAAFVRAHLQERDEVPVFVCGHSMGGGQVLSLACTPEYAELAACVRGWVLDAPFLGFAPEVRPWRLTVIAGRLLGRVAPNVKLHKPIPPEDLTRDLDVRASLAADPLLHNYGTLEGLAGMIDRAEHLSRGDWRPSPTVVHSLLLAHGTEDRAAEFAAARSWFDRFAAGTVPDATFRVYDGVYHQIHADLGREDFYRDVGDWILERCGKDDGAVAAAATRALHGAKL